MFSVTVEDLSHANTAFGACPSSTVLPWDRKGHGHHSAHLHSSARCECFILLHFLFKHSLHLPLVPTLNTMNFLIKHCSSQLPEYQSLCCSGRAAHKCTISDGNSDYTTLSHQLQKMTHFSGQYLQKILFCTEARFVFLECHCMCHLLVAGYRFGIQYNKFYATNH